jgi:hypothetical protein
VRLGVVLFFLPVYRRKAFKIPPQTKSTQASKERLSTVKRMSKIVS